MIYSSFCKKIHFFLTPPFINNTSLSFIFLMLGMTPLFILNLNWIGQIVILNPPASCFAGGAFFISPGISLVEISTSSPVVTLTNSSQMNVPTGTKVETQPWTYIITLKTIDENAVLLEQEVDGLIAVLRVCFIWIFV